MAKIGAIEAEVRKAFNVKPKEGDDFDTYLKRIVAAVDSDKSDIWDTLSDPAQTYLNSVSVALKKGEDLPTFPGGDDAEEDDEAPKAKKPAADEEDDEDEPATKKKEAPVATKKKAVAKTTAKPVKGTKGKPVTGEVKKKKADAEKPAKKKKAAPKEKAPKAKKGKSATLRIKELVFGKPDITSEQVAEKLKKEGFAASASTVASYRADFLHSMRYLKTEGVKGLPALD